MFSGRYLVFGMRNCFRVYFKVVVISEGYFRFFIRLGLRISSSRKLVGYDFFFGRYGGRVDVLIYLLVFILKL